MKTLVRKASRDSLRGAAQILRGGGLVAFPTETVYGLGARAFDANAVKRVYRAKGRPSDNPLIVHVNGFPMLLTVARRVTPLARKLIKAFWPGPLTLIFDKNPALPSAVTAGGLTVAVRCPGHPVARALIRSLGEPIAAPSANRSGRPSPTSAQHVLDDLNGRIALIIDGGACRVGLESTIVDARGRRPVLLRPGAISARRIATAARARMAAPGKSAPPAPGIRHRHYAPSCRVVLITPDELRNGRIPVLRAGDGLIHRSPWTGPHPAFARRVTGGVNAYAKSLFKSLRDAEAAGLRRVFVETVDEKGRGQAIMDRLGRAASR